MGKKSRSRVVDRVWRFMLREICDGYPIPTDAAFAHSTGSDPDRVLILGSGPAVGCGVNSHQLALPGHLARELRTWTLHGVDVDVIAESTMTAQSASDALRNRLIEPYDAVVITLGFTDSLRFLLPRAFRARMRTLMSQLDERTSDATVLLLVGMPPLRSIPAMNHALGAVVDRHARMLNAVLSELATEFTKATYVRLPALPPVERNSLNSDDYEFWAAAIASQLAPRFLASHGRGSALRRWLNTDRALEHDAVLGLRLLDTPSEPRFDRIVELTRSLFNVDVATISLIDGDRLWIKSGAGIERYELPLHQSLTHYTVRNLNATVIPDVREDTRTRHHLSYQKFGFRFYAAHPLRAPGGQIVGALTVVDSAPRPRGSVDTELLRDMALHAQRELWTTAMVGV
jgi:lysophospholipase L1-like esterase